MSQLTFFPDVDEKQVRRLVVRELKQYQALKVQMKNKQERIDKGITDNLFPKLIMNDLQNETKVIQIERAFKYSLDNLERQIIELKYLNPERQNDITIYMDLGIKKELYYEKKKNAIFMIATSLGII